MNVRDELINSPFSQTLAQLPANLRQYDITIGGCWIFRKRGPNGYAMNTTTKVLGGRKASAYRLIYEILVGPVPDGLELHHTCHNGAKGCVNPAHLEPCTHAENMERSHGIHQVHKRRTHCPQGHEYTEENTMRSRGRRYCKACAKAHHDRWLASERPPCSVEGCEEMKYCRGMCRRHYERMMNARPEAKARKIEKDRRYRERKRAS